MKNKILTFIIGVLVGAIIASIGFYVYSKNNTGMDGKGGPGMSQDGQTPPSMPDGQENNSDGNTPPEKPSGDQSQNGGKEMSTNSVETETTENTTNSNS